MKKQLLLGAALLSVACPAFADVTVTITGATAFRVATLDSIKARFVASGQPFKFAHDRNTANGTSFNGATRAIFQGTFPGVTGTTTISTSFNGSVEGLNALVNSPAADPTYLNPSVLTSLTAVVGGNNGGLGQGPVTSPVIAQQSDVAFSDVSIASTPFVGTSLQPSNPEAGVVVFTMITNEGAPGNFTNVSEQNFRALYTAGLQPLSLFTGDAADSGHFIFASGRNDGSGTRTAYLAETGYGITSLVNQYVVGTVSGDTITQIHLVPAGGFSGSIPGSLAANASTLWGQNVAGNGGYSSGTSLRADMGRTTASTEVLAADGSQLFAAGDVPLNLVTWLSLGDASAAVAAGAVVLGYNGSILENFALTGTANAADIAKVVNGVYTAWSFQQMYRRNDIVAGDKVTVYNNIKSNLVLGTTGILSTSMAVSRQVDGGVVAP